MYVHVQCRQELGVCMYMYSVTVCTAYITSKLQLSFVLSRLLSKEEYWQIDL
jgi:hypothetical protein